MQNIISLYGLLYESSQNWNRDEKVSKSTKKKESC